MLKECEIFKINSYGESFCAFSFLTPLGLKPSRSPSSMKGKGQRRKKDALNNKTIKYQKKNCTNYFVWMKPCGSTAGSMTTGRNMEGVTSHHQQRSSLDQGKQCDPLSCFISLPNSLWNSARTPLWWWEVKHSVLYLLISIQDQLLKSQQCEHSSLQWCLLL